jgi:hypothetical protein
MGVDGFPEAIAQEVALLACVYVYWNLAVSTDAQDVKGLPDLKF